MMKPPSNMAMIGAFLGIGAVLVLSSCQTRAPASPDPVPPPTVRASSRPAGLPPAPASRPAARLSPLTVQVYQALLAQEAGKRQDETAKALGIPREITLDLGNKATMRLTLIPPGTFQMGAGTDEWDSDKDRTRHEVAITKPFYIGKYHVTKGQFAAFVADSGYKTDAEKAAWAEERPPPVDHDQVQAAAVPVNGGSWKNPGFVQTDAHPAVCVSHNDAVAFCVWMSKRSGKALALPTEAQWEYAGRAGTKTARIWGDQDGEGWCNGPDKTVRATYIVWDCYPWDDGYFYTSPVDRFKPNAFGLFDMHCNAWQWCADWYGQDYYAKSPKADPPGPATGLTRIVRGGSFAQKGGSAIRWYLPPSTPWDEIGFRVICTAESVKAAQTKPASAPASKP